MNCRLRVRYAPPEIIRVAGPITSAARMPRTATPQITPGSLSDYFEVLTKAVFKAGTSWGVVEARWGGLRAAFAGFDPTEVASFTSETVDQLMFDARIVRSRAKIEATVENAAEVLELDRRHGSFRNYLRSHRGWEDAVRDLTDRFRCLDDSGAHFFLRAVGEQEQPPDALRAARS
jgi:hypothetical protein